MNELMNFQGTNVELLRIGDKVYFNPYDVGKCLGLCDVSVRTAICKMNKNQVIKLKNSDVVKYNIRKLNNAGECFLTECGVYKLIFKSNKPKAEEFANWVTDEVLPSINKTGKYEVRQNSSKKIENKSYKYIDKHYKGQLVLTLRDLEYFTGICKETFRYYIKSRTDKFILGIDYWLLKGTELRRFKTQNAKANVFAKELILITKKGFDSLNEIIGFDASPKIFIEDKEDKEEKTKYDEPVDIGIKSDFSAQKLIKEALEDLETVKGLINAFNKYNTIVQHSTYQKTILDFKDKLVKKLIAISELPLGDAKVISLDEYNPEIQKKVLNHYKVTREDVVNGKAVVAVDKDENLGKLIFML